MARHYLNAPKERAIRNALARWAEDLRDNIAAWKAENDERLDWRIESAQEELDVVEDLQVSDFPVP